MYTIQFQIDKKRENVCVYIYIYTHTHIYICVHIYMCVCLHLYTHICSYTCLLGNTLKRLTVFLSLWWDCGYIYLLFTHFLIF